MKKLSILFLFLILFNCRSAKYEGIVSSRSSTINLDGAKFVVVENSLADSQKIRIEKKSTPKAVYPEGYRIVGPAYVIGPETLAFDKPILFACPANKHNLKLAVKIANGFVPLAESRVVGETLQAKIRHGGVYFPVEVPEKYGILNPLKTDQGLLIVSDLYVGEYLEEFKKVFKKEGYDYPVWTFIYSGERSIEENAKVLSEEMKKLHAQYGDFRLDVVGFGVGGLILTYYCSDSVLYNKDISSAVVCIGTPFLGTSFALYENINNSTNPYRYYYLDGMAENAKDIAPGSELLGWIKDNNMIYINYGPGSTENKNFASIRGKFFFPGNLPEELDGDGLTSEESAKPTPIEPEPFPCDHFELYENLGVQKVVSKYIMLYRGIDWANLNYHIFKGQEQFSKIPERWERELELMFRKKIDYEALLEWEENILKSAPQDAILVTGGDMDTFTGWLLQERGIRKDILIVNWSLLNLPTYVRYLQQHGLPLHLSDEQLDSLKPYYDKETKRMSLIADQMIELLAQQHERSLAFSTTVALSVIDKYKFPLKLSGLIYRVDTGGVKGPSKSYTVDVENTKDLFFSQYHYDKLLSVPLDSLSPWIQALITNYRGALFNLQNVFNNQKKYEEALSVIRFGKKFNPSTIIAGGLYLYMFEAHTYRLMGNKNKVDSILEEALKLPVGYVYTQMDSIGISTSIKGIATIYHIMGEKEMAIKTLAKALEFTPMDKGILDLIKEYQEE